LGSLIAHTGVPEPEESAVAVAGTASQATTVPINRKRAPTTDMAPSVRRSFVLIRLPSVESLITFTTHQRMKNGETFSTMSEEASQ
jgi:hypothetical protein